MVAFYKFKCYVYQQSERKKVSREQWRCIAAFRPPAFLTTKEELDSNRSLSSRQSAKTGYIVTSELATATVANIEP